MSSELRRSRRLPLVALTALIITSALLSLWLDGLTFRWAFDSPSNRITPRISSKYATSISHYGLYRPSSPQSLSFLEKFALARVDALTADGKYESALSAAKAYYEVAELCKTKGAIKVLENCILRARGIDSRARFKSEQSRSNAAKVTVPLTQNRTVLESIALNEPALDGDIANLQMEPNNFKAAIACGNLLLLAGKPIDARTYFEFALQDACLAKPPKPDELRHAVGGIGRSIRDEDGNVYRADAFVTHFPKEMNPFWQYFIAPPSTFHSNSELSPSGLSHEPLELDPDPEDPSLKAAKDEALQRWLLEWKQDKYSEAFVGLRSKDRLLKCLQSTKLPPLELLSISRAIVFHSSNDWVISAFACAAEKKGRNTAIGMECIKRQYWAGLELAKPAMWRLIDRGDHSFLDQLYMMNVDLTNEIPDQDPYFSNLKIHGFVGAAECLWLKGKNEKALDMLGALNLRKLTPEEERANSWIHGLIYLALKRYSDAAPQFKQVATARPYAYTEEATRWYAVCLAQQRKWTLAESAFDSWVRRYHPTVARAAHVLQLMQQTQS